MLDVINKKYDRKYNAILNVVYSLNGYFTIKDISSKISLKGVSAQDIIYVTDNLKNIGIIEEGLFAFKRVR